MLRVVKNLVCECKRRHWRLGPGRSWRKAKQTLAQYSALEKPMDSWVAHTGAQGHKSWTSKLNFYTHTHGFTTRPEYNSLICILENCKNRYGDGSMHFKYLFVEQFHLNHRRILSKKQLQLKLSWWKFLFQYLTGTLHIIERRTSRLSLLPWNSVKK